MRFLNIIRHAKAENDYSKNDFERELAERGQEDSKFLDSFLFRYSFKIGWCIKYFYILKFRLFSNN